MVVEKINGNLIENGVQIMMPWEKEYMEFCIEKLEPHGDVLEIGFGLGYSATYICSNSNVKSYTVIESSPKIWKDVEEFKNKFPNLEINLVKGRWEEMLSECGKYDCVFWDPLSGYETKEENKNRWLIFLSDFHKFNSKVGSKIAMYCDNPTKHNFIEFECENYEFDVDIPKDCNYAKGDKMYVLLFKVKKEWKEFEFPVFNGFGNDNASIRIYEDFLDSLNDDIDSQVNKTFKTVGKEYILDKNLKITHDKAYLGILFIDKEKSGTVDIVLDDKFAIRNVYNNLIVFKIKKIGIDLEKSTKVYIFNI